jgi:hypothetical protein
MSEGVLAAGLADPKVLYKAYLATLPPGLTSLCREAQAERPTG